MEFYWCRNCHLTHPKFSANTFNTLVSSTSLPHTALLPCLAVNPSLMCGNPTHRMWNSSCFTKATYLETHPLSQLSTWTWMWELFNMSSRLSKQQVRCARSRKGLEDHLCSLLWLLRWMSNFTVSSVTYIQFQHMISLLEHSPDLYLDEIQEEMWVKHAIDTSITTICWTLKRLGMTSKKVIIFWMLFYVIPTPSIALKGGLWAQWRSTKDFPNGNR